MANTENSIGQDLKIFNSNNVLQLTLTNIDENIDAQTLSELTGGDLTLSQAQNAIDTRIKVDAVNCKSCLDPLPAGSFYAEYDNFQNVLYRDTDGTLICKEYKNP